jgi:hypothetical protein
MAYIFIIATWILILYLIHKYFEKKKNTPVLSVPRHSDKDKETVKITLAELSKVWERTSNKKYSLSIDELVPLYKTAIKKPRVFNISLTNKRLDYFYNQYIKDNGSFTEELMLFTIDLITFLDVKGDCSSVVKVSKLDNSKREFALLSEVSLLDHSIDVAEEMIKLYDSPLALSVIHICRFRRLLTCISRFSP